MHEKLRSLRPRRSLTFLQNSTPSEGDAQHPWRGVGAKRTETTPRRRGKTRAVWIMSGDRSSRASASASLLPAGRLSRAPGASRSHHALRRNGRIRNAQCETQSLQDSPLTPHTVDSYMYFRDRQTGKCTAKQCLHHSAVNQWKRSACAGLMPSSRPVQKRRTGSSSESGSPSSHKTDRTFQRTMG